MSDFVRGRPPVSRGEESVQISLTLSRSQFDEIIEEARKARKSTPQEWIRDLIHKVLRTKNC